MQLVTSCNLCLSYPGKGFNYSVNNSPAIERLDEETRSARSHNMDADEIMGMSSVLQKKSRHATICFLSCKTRAQKNRTGEFLHKIEELK